MLGLVLATMLALARCTPASPVSTTAATFATLQVQPPDRDTPTVTAGASVPADDEPQMFGTQIGASVFFEYGSADLTPSGLRVLEALLPQISSTGTLRLVGHTDGIGAEDLNQALSLRRAGAVAKWLRDAGTPGSVTITGVGEAGAVDGVADPSRRRVDITAFAP